MLFDGLGRDGALLCVLISPEAWKAISILLKAAQ
jgi:hypothetical protein